MFHLDVPRDNPQDGLLAALRLTVHRVATDTAVSSYFDVDLVFPENKYILGHSVLPGESP
jgi:hypothetical protein